MVFSSIMNHFKHTKVETMLHTAGHWISAEIMHTCNTFATPQPQSRATKMTSNLSRQPTLLKVFFLSEVCRLQSGRGEFHPQTPADEISTLCMRILHNIILYQYTICIYMYISHISWRCLHFSYHSKIIILYHTIIIMRTLWSSTIID